MSEKRLLYISILSEKYSLPSFPSLSLLDGDGVVDRVNVAFKSVRGPQNTNLPSNIYHDPWRCKYEFFFILWGLSLSWMERVGT